MFKMYIVLGVIAACYAATTPIEPHVDGDIIPVEIENFPYICSVQAPGLKGRRHISTGIILYSRWILTTASTLKYFTDPRAFQIRTGSNNRYNSYSVQEKIHHPSYDSNSTDFDLALLKVDKDIDFVNDQAATISLFSEHNVSANLTGSLVGYGNVYLGMGEVTKLYSVELKTVGTIDGLNLYVSVPDGVCISDVGGPFVVDNQVYGISTHNPLGCGETGQFVTRIDESTEKWIYSVVLKPFETNLV